MSNDFDHELCYLVAKYLKIKFPSIADTFISQSEAQHLFSLPVFLLRIWASNNYANILFLAIDKTSQMTQKLNYGKYQNLLLLQLSLIIGIIFPTFQYIQLTSSLLYLLMIKLLVYILFKLVKLFLSLKVMMLFIQFIFLLVANILPLDLKEVLLKI